MSGTNDEPRYHEFYDKIDPDLGATVFSEPMKSAADFTAGRYALRHYHKRFSAQADINIEELVGPYESRLAQRLIDRKRTSPRDNNVLVTIGGLGSGKSSCANQLVELLATRDSATSRTTLLVDCNAYREADDPLGLVLRGLLDATMEQLIDLWATSLSRPVTDTERQIAWAIIFGYDIRLWSRVRAQHQFPVAPTPNPLSGLPIEAAFGAADRERALEAALEALSSRQLELQDYIDSLLADPKHVALIASCALGFLASVDDKDEAMRLIVIDNLDPLPSDSILEICQSIYSIAAQNPAYDFLIPVRPSSLRTSAYISNITYIYHRGPCVFDFIYRRLLRYILTRSHAQLEQEGVLRIGLETHLETQALIGSTVIYAYVLLAGSMWRDNQDLTDVVQKARERLLEDAHSDHRDIIDAIDFSRYTLPSIAEMGFAVTGNSARMALALGNRLLLDFYYHPSTLIDVIDRANRRSAGDARRVNITYKRLIQTLFFSATKKRSVKLGRYLNLFVPVETHRNPGQPSLVQVRILMSLARRSSQTLRSLRGDLACYGVPNDIFARSLKQLSAPLRRLVWLSNNRAIKNNSIETEDYAVISERGVSYAEALICNFDYLWVCGATLKNNGISEINFVEKLSLYAYLVADLLEIEFKQIIFAVSGKGEVRTSPGRKADHLTLELLLKSIPRAIGSSRVAFSTTESETQYVKQLARFVATVCRLLEKAIIQYKFCFGDAGYIQDQTHATAATEAMRDLLRRSSKSIEPEHREIIESTIDRLLRDVDELAQVKAERLTRPDAPSFDIISATAEGFAWVLPDKKMKAINDLALSETERKILADQQTHLGRLLRTTLLRFTELERETVKILASLEAAIRAKEQSGVAGGNEKYLQLRREHEWWKNIHEDLEASEFAVPEDGCSRTQMDELKSKLGKRIDLIIRLTGELGVEIPIDLGAARWS